MKKVEEEGEEKDEKETAVLFLRRNNSTFDKQSGTKNTALFLRGNNSTFDKSLSEPLIPAKGIIFSRVALDVWYLIHKTGSASDGRLFRHLQGRSRSKNDNGNGNANGNGSGNGNDNGNGNVSDAQSWL